MDGRAPTPARLPVGCSRSPSPSAPRPCSRRRRAPTTPRLRPPTTRSSATSGGRARSAPSRHGTARGGAGTIVAIVDSGIDLGHPDLSTKVLSGKTFLGCGSTGCGNGDWQSGPRGQREGNPHGTHVAGIAGAATSNGRGIAGVAPAARLLAVRVLDDEGGGTTTDVARGIRYSADRGADVINLSLGSLPGGDAFEVVGLPDPVRRAVAYANKRGVVVVAASGNSTAPLCDEPGGAPGVLCVTATDRRQARAGYANEPLKRDLLAVAAPGGSGISFAACGEGILSTFPPGEGQADCGYPGSKAYGDQDGTSMALTPRRRHSRAARRPGMQPQRNTSDPAPDRSQPAHRHPRDVLAAVRLRHRRAGVAAARAARAC